MRTTSPALTEQLYYITAFLILRAIHDYCAFTLSISI
jgi:hypothetical protein